MYSDKKHKHRFLPAAVFLAAAAVSGYCMFKAQTIRDDGASALKSAVQRCAVQCYVAEGFYPPGLSYLEEHYGLKYNKAGYYVTYGIFASNIPPDIRAASRK